MVDSFRLRAVAVQSGFSVSPGTVLDLPELCMFMCPVFCKER